MTRATLSLLLLVSTGCAPPPHHRAAVELAIDGTSFDYVTHRAQRDEPVAGGPVSVYLMPDVPEARAPYACLRYYSGNPVGHLWVRHRKAGATDEDATAKLPRYECFVPGRLSDGTETLGWKKADGSERHKTETGEADCTARVTKAGGELRLEFEGLLRAAKGKKKGKQADKSDAVKAADTIRVKGRAVLRLGG